MNYISTNFNNTIPKLYEQQNKPNQIASAKYNVPLSAWSWIILEYSELQQLFYGYILPEKEYGYFTVDDLLVTAMNYEVDIILDPSFKKQLLSEIII